MPLTIILPGTTNFPALDAILVPHLLAGRLRLTQPWSNVTNPLVAASRASGPTWRGAAADALVAFRTFQPFGLGNSAAETIAKLGTEVAR